MAKRYGTEQNIHENPDQNPNFKIYISKGKVSLRISLDSQIRFQNNIYDKTPSLKQNHNFKI